ncbi:protein translocase subunit SecF [Brachybacterium ginsengisoli]|uniref:protein translocase subunit SecF n=1 Tax=Brachybacterium ginsengisoli TaxID=1331682 RepID=UPI001D130EFA|nr:protein translocase subunit SecF [Brachybacterium ginsengisoli]
MTATFARFGNDLHDGRRTVPIVTRRRTWYLFSLVLVVLLVIFSVLRGPNLGIEFTGGSEFQVAGVADTEQTSARDVIRDHVPGNEPKISVLGGSAVRVQTEQLDSAQTAAVASDLAEAYGVPAESVSTSYIGPVWSGDVTQKMMRGVVVFLALVATMMALYFRNLKSSLAAMAALVHDMLVTAGVYLVVGFEITPGTVIGFLTVMGYSLYDTIVVFDKVRENTADLVEQRSSIFADQVQRAANQTLVRSINTSVVALLPVGAILFIGAFLLGAGTLKDISLALFIGIIAGTYSSVFLAPGFLVDLRRREPAIAAHTASVLRTRRGEESSVAEDGAAQDRRGARTAITESASEDADARTDVGTVGDEAAADVLDTDEPGTRNGHPGGSTAPDSVGRGRQPRRTTRRDRGTGGGAR